MRFSRKDRTSEVNKLFVIWLFPLSLQARNWSEGITGEYVSGCALQLRIRARITEIGSKHKPFTIILFKSATILLLFSESVSQSDSQLISQSVKFQQSISINEITFENFHDLWDVYF